MTHPSRLTDSATLNRSRRFMNFTADQTREPHTSLPDKLLSVIAMIAVVSTTFYMTGLVVTRIQPGNAFDLMRAFGVPLNLP